MNTDAIAITGMVLTAVLAVFWHRFATRRQHVGFETIILPTRKAISITKLKLSKITENYSSIAAIAEIAAITYILVFLLLFIDFGYDFNTRFEKKELLEHVVKRNLRAQDFIYTGFGLIILNLIAFLILILLDDKYRRSPDRDSITGVLRGIVKLFERGNSSIHVDDHSASFAGMERPMMSNHGVFARSERTLHACELRPSELIGVEFNSEADLDRFLDAFDDEFHDASYELPDETTVILPLALKDWATHMIETFDLEVCYVQVKSPEDLDAEARNKFNSSRSKRFFGRVEPLKS